MKPGHLNAGPDHLSWIETGGEPKNIEEELLDAQLFRVDIEDDYYAHIIQFLATGIAPEEFSISKKTQLVVKASNFQLISD